MNCYNFRAASRITVTEVQHHSVVCRWNWTPLLVVISQGDRPLRLLNSCRFVQVVSILPVWQYVPLYQVLQLHLIVPSLTSSHVPPL